MVSVKSEPIEGVVVTEGEANRIRAPRSSPSIATSIGRATIWSVSGQVATLAASFIATPFVLRRLAPEGYGLLTLSNVLVGYLAVADLGMGVTSTRFAAEAHARGDRDEEAGVIWTSLVISVLPSIVLAVALVLGAGAFAEHALRVPNGLRPAAVVALRLTALGFVARGIAGVLNTAELVRMRMDILTLINSGTGILQICLVPVVLALGGGLVAAVAVVAGMAVVNATAHGLAGCWLAPGLWRPAARGDLVKPLVRFGLAVVVSALVGLALADAEKLLLPRLASVSDLGYYAVAFTLARLLVVVPGALSQSLLPAFSRLHGVSDQAGLRDLYQGGLRTVLLCVVPLVLLFLVAGGPFLTFWAGPEYGRRSELPLHILVIGVACNALAMVPYNFLCAAGRADAIARYNLVELVPYLAATALMTYWYGIVGTAFVWSLRVAISTLFFVLAVQTTTGLSPFGRTGSWSSYLLAGAALFLPTIILPRNPSWSVAVGTVLVSLLAYGGLVWMRVLDASERAWVVRLLSRSVRSPSAPGARGDDLEIHV